MMKLQVRNAVVLGIAAALFVSSAPNADAGGLLSKLFNCKKDEAPACCCPEPEPEPECCPAPAPEPMCCEPAPAPEPMCCEPAPAPEPMCCEPAPAPEPMCCEPEPAPAPEPAPCCEPAPAPEPAPCCASFTPQSYPMPELAEGEVLISISPINFSSEPVDVVQPEATEIIQIAAQ